MTLRRSFTFGHRRHLLCLVVLGAVPAVWAPASAADASRSARGSASVTLVGARIVRPDGTLDDGMAVVVRAGKIRRLVPEGNVPSGSARRFDSPAVICPGLIDLFSTVGAVGQTAESVSAVDPEANALDAVDPQDPHFDTALRSGITAVMVAPEPENLVGGVAATLRTFVDEGKLDVLRDDGPLLLAFGSPVWRQDRAPTSRAGTLHELRALIEKAQDGTSHPRINEALAGRRDALVACREACDVDAVRRVLGDAADRFGIVHTADAIDLAEDLAACKRPVIVGPFSFTTSRRELLGPQALDEAGVEVAFSGQFPESPPVSLRLTAALAVRHGLDPAAARRGITVNPAKTAGVADRVGSLAPGRDADLVVFSDDPLRLDSRVLEVYIKGVRVYCAANQDMDAAGAGP